MNHEMNSKQLQMEELDSQILNKYQTLNNNSKNKGGGGDSPKNNDQNVEDLLSNLKLMDTEGSSLNPNMLRS